MPSARPRRPSRWASPCASAGPLPGGHDRIAGARAAPRETLLRRDGEIALVGRVYLDGGPLHLLLGLAPDRCASTRGAARIRRAPRGCGMVRALGQADIPPAPAPRPVHLCLRLFRGPAHPYRVDNRQVAQDPPGHGQDTHRTDLGRPPRSHREGREAAQDSQGHTPGRPRHPRLHRGPHGRSDRQRLGSCGNLRLLHAPVREIRGHGEPRVLCGARPFPGSHPLGGVHRAQERGRGGGRRRHSRRRRRDGERFGTRPPLSEHELLARLSPDTFIVLLKHMPVVGDSSSGLFDLQLSGHTHRGQIFPFRSWCGLSSRMSPGATPCPRAPCST